MESTTDHHHHLSAADHLRCHGDGETGAACQDAACRQKETGSRCRFPEPELATARRDKTNLSRVRPRRPPFDLSQQQVMTPIGSLSIGLEADLPFQESSALPGRLASA